MVAAGLPRHMIFVFNVGRRRKAAATPSPPRRGEGCGRRCGGSVLQTDSYLGAGPACNFVSRCDLFKAGEALGVNRAEVTSAMERLKGSHFRPRVLACFWAVMAFAPFAFSTPPNAQQIVRLSLAATEADWQAISHFSDIERDADTKDGSTTSKTYQVLMIDGSPYSRLIAFDNEPLSPVEQARECTKLQRVFAKRAVESPRQPAKRLAVYREDRNRMFALMHGMAQAFDFKKLGEERLEGSDVYVLEATPRPGYQPTSRETNEPRMSMKTMDRRPDRQQMR